MSVKTCPHCNSEIPAGMEVMPVCVMCGGDINAAPTQTWATLDMGSNKTYECPECQTEIKSVLTTECPNCHVALQLAAQATPDQVAAHGPVPDPVPDPVIPTPEPVSMPEPVAPIPEPMAMPEPVAPTPEPIPIPEPVAMPEVAPVPAFTPPEPEPVLTPEPQPKFVPEPVSSKPAPAAKEGFFGKLLRMLGLKK